MARPKIEWDPSWDDDWQVAQTRLQELIDDNKPENPEEVVEYYRYGFSAARRRPLPIWSDVESRFYEDYMSMPERQAEEESDRVDSRQHAEWVRRGWEDSRD